MRAAEQCVRDIRDAVLSIRGIVRDCSTLSVVGRVFAYYLHRGQPGTSIPADLLSPARQLSFLLGQLVATPNPDNPRQFDEEDWNSTVDRLNRAFMAYEHYFYPDDNAPDDALSSMPPEWRRVREVVIPAFLHYHNEPILASVEQIAARIKAYIVPFDLILAESWRISASTALAIAEFASMAMQDNMDALQSAFRDADALRVSLSAEAEKSGWTLEQLRGAAQRDDYKSRFSKMFTLLNKAGLIDARELKAKFGRDADTFLDHFSIARGDGPTLDYPTERSILDDRPLVQVEPDRMMVPLANTLYSAILRKSERTLSEGPRRDVFFRARAAALEDEAARLLTNLLSNGEDDLRIFRNVFETPDSTYEHDYVAITGDACFVSEAKAAPPVEPFREPEKAFARLRQGFRAETGIQSAFEQASRIRRALSEGNPVSLYDINGQLIVTLPPSLAPNTFCICVTRDSFGPLATDLALLLERQSGEPYPWVVSTLDLESMVDAWRYLGWGREKLVEYLRIRVQLHGKVFSTDELDFVGYFIRHGSLYRALYSPGDKLLLDGHYSGIFDEIYFHRRYGGPAPDLTVSEPFTSDLKRSLIVGDVVPVNVSDRRGRIGRNDPCFCGSGMKFKKCHGRAQVRS